MGLCPRARFARAWSSANNNNNNNNRLQGGGVGRMVHGQNFRANGNIFIYFNVLIFYKSQLIIFRYFLNKKGFTAQGLFTVKRPTSVFFTNTAHPDL